MLHWLLQGERGGVSTLNFVFTYECRAQVRAYSQSKCCALTALLQGTIAAMCRRSLYKILKEKGISMICFCRQTTKIMKQRIQCEALKKKQKTSLHA